MKNIFFCNEEDLGTTWAVLRLFQQILLTEVHALEISSTVAARTACKSFMVKEL